MSLNKLGYDVTKQYNTHQLTTIYSQTQAVIVEEQRALAQDHEILLQNS